MGTPNRTIPITVSIQPELWDTLHELAHTRRTTKRALIEQALVRYFDYLDGVPADEDEPIQIETTVKEDQHDR